MDGVLDSREAIICSAAKRLKGHQRRLFMAEATTALCEGNARRAEERFGWGRETIKKGLRESKSGIRCLEDFAARARPRWEEKNPRLAADIRAIVEPSTHVDPELKTSRCYTNMSAKEVCSALLEKGYASDDAPKERTMRDILNRMGYRLKRIQKGKPLKKTKDTDPIFANVKAAKEKYKDDPEALQISMDTKAKVNEGPYARGGKNPDRLGRENAQRMGS